MSQILWDPFGNAGGCWVTRTKCPAFVTLDVVIRTLGENDPPSEKQLATLALIAGLPTAVRKPIRKSVRRYAKEHLSPEEYAILEPEDLKFDFNAALIPPMGNSAAVYFFVGGGCDIEMEHGLACLCRNGDTFLVCDMADIDHSDEGDASERLEALLSSRAMRLEEGPCDTSGGGANSWRRHLPVHAQAPAHVAPPDWLSAIRENAIERFMGWLEGGGTLKEKFTPPEAHIPLTVVDYLTREGSVDLLRSLLDRGLLKPEQLSGSWSSLCLGDVERFQALMPLLPKSVWSAVLASPCVWEFMPLFERLAEAGVDFDAPIDDEGATPLHRAVQVGNLDGGRWLIAHGADVHKPDKYQRTAFVWAESGPGFACLPILEGKANPTANRPAAPDAPGLAVLREAAAGIESGETLRLAIQIKSPPVTRIEKAYYPTECHYLLTMDLDSPQVTYKDMTSPRQDYLYADGSPAHLYAPILQWPELTPLWETLEVQEFTLQKAIKNCEYVPKRRPDLIDAARSLLKQAFDAEEAAARGIELRK